MVNIASQDFGSALKQTPLFKLCHHWTFEWLNFLSLTLINCLITVQAFVPLFAKEKRFCELRGRADI